MEVFTITAMGVLILGLIVYCCLGVRTIILKRRKINAEWLKLENDKIAAENENREKELRRNTFLELLPEAIEMGVLQLNQNPWILNNQLTRKWK